MNIRIGHGYDVHKFGGDKPLILAGVTIPGAQGVLELEDSLRRLAQTDDRAARVAELRIFGALSVESIAKVLGTSVPTVNRDWRFAKAYLEQQYGLMPSTSAPAAATEATS